ncbi:MAG: DUF4383 domain-containing protein [Nanoarchaeota archaeon]
MQKTVAIVFGVVLLILGVWGFIQAPILSLFGVNTLQNIVHLVGGVLGIWLGMNGGKGFNLWTGWIALVLGILGFIPGISGILAGLLGINTAISVLHVVVGVVLLVVAYKAD